MIVGVGHGDGGFDMSWVIKKSENVRTVYFDCYYPLTKVFHGEIKTSWEGVWRID